MQDSAEGPRVRRRAETVNSLVRAARIATAEQGLHGFTIEDLCEQAGVSRRTFFNYFASKEDAVLGIPLHRDDTALIEAFLAGGGAGDGVSPHLLDDLAALTVARLRSMDIAPDTASELVAAVDREPRLLARVLTLTNEGEREDARLVAQRENLPPGDVRAEVAAITIGALSRASTAEFLATEHAVAFEEIFTRRLEAARSLFATQIARPVEGPL